MSDWQPPSNEFDVREERTPWGRYIVYAFLLGLVLAGAIWLTSQVVIEDVPPDQPRIDIAQDTPDEPAPLGADEAAWVRALEKDTLQGYRDYLTEFPDGKFVDKAQEQIDVYDNRDWATAEQRNTIAGYEDYLAEWENGLHADKARERINEMQAALDAAARDAAERAAREQADWDRAARENTIASYETYLTQHPTGLNADTARARIQSIRIAAADEAAWSAASAANTADAYQQYLNSFPQGAHVAAAIAAIERLRPSVGRTFSDCDVCPRMTVLPGGTDTLGAVDGDETARANEKPARPVSFSAPFAMSVNEVTFADYDACVADGKCDNRPDDKGWGRGSRPVINVSWQDAQDYVAWLSGKTGFTYALPSEAQWEYGARAGSDNVHVGGSAKALCAFANGASKETGVAWSNKECTDPGVGRTLPVGTLSANDFGLKDMIGNVAEWTMDCNTLNLRDAPVDGSPDGRGSCAQRVVRGGSWFSGADDLRLSARSMLRRGDRNDFTGFRVIRVIDG